MHEHCRFCVIDDATKDGACCICVRWRKKPKLKNTSLLDADKYIEAINGARKMRHRSANIFGWNTRDYDVKYLLNKWWDNAHNYSDPALPRVYEWGKFHAD